MRKLLITGAKTVVSAISPVLPTIARPIGVLARSQRGTGLIEVIVALALLGTVGTAFLGAIRTGLGATAVINEQAVSRNLAYSQLEEIRAGPYKEIYAVTVEPPAGYSLSISTEVVPGNMQKIHVTVVKNGTPLMALEDLKAIQ